MSLFGSNIKKMEEKNDIQGLIEELKNKDPKVRMEVVQALSELNHTKGLIEASKNDNPEVRVQAIRALRSVDGSDVMEALVDILTTDEVEIVWQEAFEALGRFSIKDEMIWMRVAMELLKNGRGENALTCFEKVTELNPDKETTGYICVALTDYELNEDALQYFERYVEIDPNDARGWGGKGIALFVLKRHEEAEPYLKKALEIDPKLKGARDTLCAIYYEKHDYEAVALFAKETLQFTPEDIKAHIMLSEAWACSGKLIEAESEAQRALEFLNQRQYLEPQDLSMVHQQLAVIYTMRGQREQALEEIRKAIRANPTDTWLHKLFSAYIILDITGSQLTGTPVERRNRLFELAKMRDPDVAFQDVLEYGI